MSRRSFPRIDPSALRDHADEARIDRIWERIDQDLANRSDRGARRSTWVTLAVAASLGAFVAGIAVGKATWGHRAEVANVTPDDDKSFVEVLAAGSQLRTFPLKGGGHITLSPGATAEVERAGSALTVSLLQGQASVEAAGRKEIAIVAGAARIHAGAGARFSLTRNASDLDVNVDDGTVSVTAPDGSQQTLDKGQRLNAVPIQDRAVASTPTDTEPRPAIAMRRPKGSGAMAMKVAGQPEWFTRYRANDEEGALALLRKAGVDQSIASARTADELIAIGEMMRSKGRDQEAAVRAYRRVVESFQANPYAPIAASTLADMYKGDPVREKEYREKTQILAMTGDASFCNLIDQETDKAKAAQRAKEYLGKYPNGQCRERIKDMVPPEEPAPAPPASAPLAPPAAPAAPPAAPLPAPPAAPPAPAP